MINEPIFREPMLAKLGQLDDLLATRQRLRNLYTFLVDAYSGSEEPIWFVYANFTLRMGRFVNKEIDTLCADIIRNEDPVRFEGMYDDGKGTE